MRDAGVAQVDGQCEQITWIVFIISSLQTMATDPFNPTTILLKFFFSFNSHTYIGFYNEKLPAAQ